MSTPAYFVAPWDLNRELACVPPQPDAGSVVLVESRAKGAALPYHRKKLVLVLSAMRHFAEELEADGFDVEIVNAPTYVDGIRRHVEARRSSRVVAMEPREWGLTRALDGAAVGVPIERHDDGGEGGHFLLTREECREWLDGRSRIRMADFYRWMRKRTGYLMEDGSPAGGSWSYDSENREHAKGVTPPEVERHPPDRITRRQMERVREWGGHWGAVDGFDWPVTRSTALAELDRFFGSRAACFGRYQDAMLADAPFLWHALLSPPLNLSLLSPKEICDRIVVEYEAGRMPIASAEGLLRQIIGWREFMRMMYWARMPDLRDANLLGADRLLPDFYWDPARTEMRCLRQSIGQVLESGYGHHIQRLMVQGNFALLAGVAPLEISHWFWAAFVDAYEWVELPNVHGMAVYADDSFTTKPYAASGSYIHRMSDYFGECRYDVKQRSGEDACPFNHLYWSFMVRHRERFAGNRRLAMLYRTWDRMDPEDREATLGSAEEFLEHLKPPPESWRFDDDAG